MYCYTQIENCQLQHIISLWRILNVEQARQIANGKEVCIIIKIIWTFKSFFSLQDPFPGISEVFKVALDDNEKTLLEDNLHSYDIDQFIEVFYEFIVTNIRNRDEAEADYP